MRRCVSISALTALLTTVCITAAGASPVWKWSYSGDGIQASGTFITLEKADANGGYLITVITGTRNGERITALQPAGTAIPGNEPYTVDNLVFKGPGPQLTSHGFGFATSGGNYSNPFYADFLSAPGYLEFFSMPPSHSHTELPVLFSATLVPAPEPGTGALLYTAIALAGLTLRRMKQPRQ